MDFLGHIFHKNSQHQASAKQYSNYWPLLISSISDDSFLTFIRRWENLSSNSQHLHSCMTTCLHSPPLQYVWNKMSQSLIQEFKYWAEKNAEVSYIFVAQARIINNHKIQGLMQTAVLQVEIQQTWQEIWLPTILSEVLEENKRSNSSRTYIT